MSIVRNKVTLSMTLKHHAACTMSTWRRPPGARAPWGSAARLRSPLQHCLPVHCDRSPRRAAAVPPAAPPPAAHSLLLPAHHGEFSLSDMDRFNSSSACNRTLLASLRAASAAASASLRRPACSWVRRLSSATCKEIARCQALLRKCNESWRGLYPGRPTRPTEMIDGPQLVAHEGPASTWTH
jgi:hypothetical protein